MEYQEAASFLFDLRRYPQGTGLESTRRLLAHLDDPQADLAVVQVAGTNGKGSTASMVERVLREAGLDVGLYTSPHLEDLHERIRTNGRPLSEAAVVEFVTAVEDHVTDRAAANAAPTFFETLTALALWAFDRADVDVAVLEVGIGGRYDATSVTDPVASAVTDVSLEHQDMLGDTVEEIARDKAQVAPADAPLVTAAVGEALAAIRTAADDVVTVGAAGDGRDDGDDGTSGGDDGTSESDDRDDPPDVTVDYRGREGIEGRVTLTGPDWSVETSLALLGAHQALNAGVAAALCRQVAEATGHAVGTDALARGLRNAHWPGRFEVMEREPLVVLDGAHNPGACARVAATLSEFDHDDLHLVFGSMCDKDHAGMVDALPVADRVYTCRPALDRAESERVLATAFEGQAGAVEAHPDVPAALTASLDAADPDDCVLVTGSLHTVAEARERWNRVAVPRRVRDATDAERTLLDANVPAADRERRRGETVHRVVSLRVLPRQAAALAEAMPAVGGECVRSGLRTQDRERYEVVLAGTLDEFARLVDRLDDAPQGLPAVADDVREAVGLSGRAPVDEVGEAGGGASTDAGDGTSPDARDYPWTDGTAVMGVLNVTPDSFHDGGEYDAREDAVARAREMIAVGADVVDVGGESTRPGAEPVPVEEETRRVVPVVEAIADADALVSIDTRKAEVARAALDAGADVLNDVSGLEDPEMRLVAAEYDVPVIVMHSIETPVDPDVEVEYDDVVSDTLDQLRERVLLAEKVGLDRDQVIVDPGLGFGKSAAECFELLDRIDEFRALGCPVLVGHSHKSMFELTGGEAGDALFETVAGTTLAAERGADVVRVHDVAANVAAVRTVEAARSRND